MVIQLQPLSGNTIDEHICERYIELNSNSDALKQDLGIFDKSASMIDVDIEPPIVASKKKRSRRKDSNLRANKEEKLIDSYNLNVEQSITSLFSNQDNSNSTTGYVLWSTTPFFIRWLLYDVDAAPFRVGGKINVTDRDKIETTMNIPPILTIGDSSAGILELGSGISGILPVILGNYVSTYVCTDQKGILNKMKANIKDNLLQMNKRRCISNSLGLEDLTDNDSLPGSVVKLEVMSLDWEKFQLHEKIPPELQIVSENSRVYIIAMDVIYNEYLIDPFLNTLEQLLKFFQGQCIQVHCLIGVHLRAQEVVADFLRQATLEHNLPMKYIQSASLEKTRFNLYFI